MNSEEALKELKTNALIECDWELERLKIIEKDLEILYMLKKNMRVESEIIDGVEYEYIAYNYWELDIENKEEFNKIKEWLQK